MRAFFVQIFQQSQNVTRKMTFVQKIPTYNVDEIDTWTEIIFLVVVQNLFQEFEIKSKLKDINDKP